MPGSRASPAIAAQNALSDGCDVRSAIDAIAKSMMSQPAALISSATARLHDDVQCVWKWIGSASPAPARIASTSGRAARGLSSPAMSLMPITCAPAAAHLAASSR